MANMKYIFAALWGVTLISQVYGQEKTGHFCKVVTQLDAVESVTENTTTYSVATAEDCNSQKPDDVLISRYIFDGLTVCDFNRSTTTSQVFTIPVTRNITTEKCCEGYGGDNCTEALCERKCQHSGMCSEPNKCNCTGTGYEGNFCEKAQCNPPCANGECSDEKICNCEKGWEGADCTKPICNQECQNNGNCTGPNICTCPENWAGNDCSQRNSPCENVCLNHGICGDNGDCLCSDGYAGDDCGEPICKQQCQNGGTCIEPNVCQCPNGFRGDECEDRIEKHFHTHEITKTAMRYLVSGNIEGRLKASACISWTSNQYMTFDDLTFYLPGRCIYNLVSHNDELFHIRVNNAFDCKGNLCKRSVIIETSEESTLVLFPNGTATHNGKFFNIPRTLLGKVVVERLGRYTVAILVGGAVEVFFDNDMMVLVRVSESYKNQLNGLCGNFDDDDSNEKTLSDGNLVKNLFDFGNRMRFGGSFGEGMCAEIQLNTPHPCHGIDDYTKSEIKQHCDILNSNRFSAGHNVVNVEPYEIRCRAEACAAGLENIEESVCASLTSYSRICSYHGVVLSWRSEGHCPIQCFGGQRYSECGSSHVRTCKNYDSEENDLDNVCIDGCVCPTETVLDSSTGTCEFVKDCKCTYADRSYHPGNIIRQECNKCICKMGRWECTKHDCAQTCKVIGEDHYRTFDGKDYQFSSECEHVLVQTDASELAKIVIWVENKGCGFYDYEACEKTVSMVLYEHETISLKGGDRVMVGMNDVALPYTEKDGKFKIFKFSSTMLRVVTKDGLDFRWDRGHRMYLKLEPYYKNKVYGLCGTFNYNQVDDFTLPNWLPTVDVAEFGNAWGKDRSCCVTKKVALDGCSKSSMFKRQAKDECSILRSDLFQHCNHILSPTHHIAMCQSDVCRNIYKNLATSNAKCTIFSDYARMCTLLAEQAISNDWRNYTGCLVECDGGRVFHGCMSSCEKTCKMLATDDNPCEKTDSSCSEGCICPDGEVFDESSNKCVATSYCPCYHQNIKYKAGDTRQSLCDTCTCTNGRWSCESIPSCTTENICPLPGQVWVKCTQCQRSCDNQQVSCQQTACHEGCACAEGLVAHNDACIKSSECPCSHGDRSYKPGEEIKKGCNKCTCRNSTWECTQKKCPSVCQAYGDPHYITFDGKKYAYHGDCTYTLVEDFCRRGVGSFRILVENVACSTGGLTCTKAVKIVFHDTVIKLIRGSEPIIGKNPLALVGTPIASYQLRQYGVYWIFKTWVGLKVMWDGGTRVYVHLAPKFMGRVCGLCGDFDGDASNDFRTRQGDLETLASHFGDSWKAYYNCPNSEEEPIHPCTRSPHRVEWAKLSCSIIRGDLFSNCHALVDPEPYYESCIWDACGCDRGGDCECLCTAIAAYARDCAENGQPVRWRSSKVCGIQCENGTTYNECGSTKSDMCFDDPIDATFSSTCVEGCHCPAGTIRHQGSCIKQTRCPCMLDGKEVPPGYVDRSPCQLCTCIKGRMNCVSTPSTCPNIGTTPSTTKTTPYGSTSEATTTASTAPTTTSAVISTTTACPYDKEFTYCANRCQPKCHYNQGAEGECNESTEDCEPGCVCPGKKVLNENGTCVETMDCDCKDNEGNPVKSGSTWKQLCETCRCFNNEVTCSPQECPTVTCAGGTVLGTKANQCCQTCVRTAPLTTLSTVTSTEGYVTGSPTMEQSTTLLPTTTAPTCNEENGEVYGPCMCVPECGKEMNESCVDPGDENGKCCVCADGKVKDETGKCVAKKECFCTDKDGVRVYPGEPRDKNPCIRCLCVDGHLSCSEYCGISNCFAVGMNLTYDENNCCSCKAIPVTSTTPSTHSTTTSTEIETTTLTCQCHNDSYISCKDCEACILKTALCDGTAQCTDGSDEKDCNCTFRGEEYESGEDFSPSYCQECDCKDGKVSCTKSCVESCSPGFYLRRYDDDDERCCECLKATTAAPPETTSTKAETFTTPIASTKEPTTISQTPVETTTTAIVTTEVTTTSKEELTTTGLCDSALEFESHSPRRPMNPANVYFDRLTKVTGISMLAHKNETGVLYHYSISFSDTRDGNFQFIKDSDDPSNAYTFLFEENNQKITFPLPVLATAISVDFKEPQSIPVPEFQLYGCVLAEESTVYLVSTTTEKTVTTTSPVETEKSTTASPTTSKTETTTTEVQTFSPVTETVNTTAGPIASTTVTTRPVTESRETTTKVIEEIVTTVTATSPPVEKCDEKMGLDAESTLRPGIRFTASSTAEGSMPDYGRLNSADKNGNPRAWTPAKKFQQYFQIESDEPMNVTAILIQGDGVKFYVKKFSVAYKLNESDDWKYVEVDGNIKNFTGPTNAADVHQVNLPAGIELRVIRLRPSRWHGEIFLRTDLLGCYKEITITTVKTTTTSGAVIIAETKPSTTTSIATTSSETEKPTTEVETTTTKEILPTTVFVNTAVTKLSGGTTTTTQETSKPTVTETVQSSTTPPPTTVTTTPSVVVQTETTTRVPSTASTEITSKQTTAEIVSTKVITSETSTRTTKKICEKDVELGDLYIRTIGASSQLENHDALKSFFGPDIDNPDDNGWSPKADDNRPYIEYIFKKAVVITSVITRSASTQSSYRMKYFDGSDFVPVPEYIDETLDLDTEEMLSTVNDDHNNAYRNHLDIPINTTAVQIYPINSRVVLKVALYGCPPEEVATTPVVIITSKEITTTTSTPVTETMTEQASSTQETPTTPVTATAPIITEISSSESSTAKSTTVESVAVKTTTEMIPSTTLSNSEATKVVVSTTRQVSTVTTRETPTTESETTTATRTSKTIVTSKTVPSTATSSATSSEATPTITVTTVKNMPVTSQVVVSSTPKFSTQPTTGTSRTTEKVTTSQRPTAIVSTTAARESTPASLPTAKPTESIGSTSVVETTSETTKIAYTTQEMCDEKMGMRYYDIPDENIKASSSLDGSKPEYAQNLRVGDDSDNGLTDKAWYPDPNDPEPYLEVTFPEEVEVTSILTQGDGSDSYFPRIYVQYKSDENEEFEYALSNDESATFDANSNGADLVSISFPKKISAKVFRIKLIRRSGDPESALRVEFRVCVKAITVPVVTTTTTETKVTTQKTPEASTSAMGETTTASESIETTTTVTEITTPVTPATTSKQPTETTTVVTVTRNLTEATSTEITETVSQSTVKTTEKPIVTTKLATSTEHPSSAASTAAPVATQSETTPSTQTTSEAISPTILVSTTVTETKPVTTTRSIITESSEAPQSTTSTAAVTPAKPQVTTSVTVTTRKPEMTEITKETGVTTTTSPIVSTTSAASTTGQPKAESTTESVEINTTGMKTEQPTTSPKQTPPPTTSIVHTTTAKVVTVESTTIKHCDEDMGMEEVIIPDDGIKVSSSSDDSEPQYIKASYENKTWKANASDSRPYVRIKFIVPISLAAIEHIVPSANYTIKYLSGDEMVPIHIDSKDKSSLERIFNGVGTTVLDEPIELQTIEFDLITSDGSPTIWKAQLFSCRALATVPGTTTTTTVTITTAVVPTTKSQSATTSASTTPQTQATSTSVETTSAPSPSEASKATTTETTTALVSESQPTVVTNTETVTKETTPLTAYSTSAPSSVVVITTTTVKSTTGKISETTTTKEIEKTSTIPISTTTQPVATTTTTKTPGTETESTSTAGFQSTASPKVTQEIVISTAKLITEMTTLEVSSAYVPTIRSEVPTTSSPGTTTAQTEKTSIPVTTAPPKSCDEVMQANYQQTTKVSPPQISSSSNMDDAKRASIDSVTFWSPKDTDVYPIVWVTYEKPVYLTGIITQGDGADNYVETMGVILDKDFEIMAEYTFNANNDSTSKNTYEFPQPVLAETVAINPIEFYGRRSMRFEVIGCFSIVSASSTPKTTQYSSATTALPTSTVSSAYVPTTRSTTTSSSESTTAPSTEKTTLSTRIVATSEGHTTEETTVVTETKVTTVMSATGSTTPVVVEHTKETTVARTTPAQGNTTPVETTTAVSAVTKETTVTTPIVPISSTTETVPKTTKYTVTTVQQTSKSKAIETPYSTTPIVSKEVKTSTRQETVETTETPVKTESSSPLKEVTTTMKSSPLTTEVVATTEIAGTETTTSPPVVISTTRTVTTAQPTIPESTTTVFVSGSTVGAGSTTLAESETTTTSTKTVSEPTESSTTATPETPVLVSTTVTTSNVTKVVTTPGPCSDYLGMTTHVFTEGRVSASTEKFGKEAKYAAVSFDKEDDIIPPAWSPEDYDQFPYLTVTFSKPVTIHSILTQGGGNREFVTKYNVGYIDANSDSDELVFITKKPTGPQDENSVSKPEKKTFPGNTNDKIIVVNDLDDSIDTTEIRIYPLRNSSNDSIAMRVEFQGCVKIVSIPTTAIVHLTKEVTTTTSTPIATETEPGTTGVSVSVTETTTKEVMTKVPVTETTTAELTTAAPTYTETSTTKVVAITTTVTKGPTTEHPEICEEGKEVPISENVSVTYQASSNNVSAENGRLNISAPTVSWYPEESDPKPHLEIDYNDTVTVTSLRVRGSVDNETNKQTYVKTFVVEFFHTDTEKWEVLKENGTEKLYEANEDGTTVKTAALIIPISTKRLRISPREWEGLASICIEAMTCQSFVISKQLTTTTSKSTVTTTETPITETFSELPSTTTEAPTTVTSAVMVTSTTKVYPTTKVTTRPGITATTPVKTPETAAVITTSVYVKPTEQPGETTTHGKIYGEKTATTTIPSSTTTLATELSTHTEMVTSFGQTTTASPKPIVSSTAQPGGETTAATTQQTSTKSTTIYPTTTTVIVVTSAETNAPTTTSKTPGTSPLISSKSTCKDCEEECEDGFMMSRDPNDCCRCTYATETSTTQFTVTSALSPTTKQTTTLSSTPKPSCENKTCPYLTTECGEDGSKCPDACNCPKGSVYDGTRCLLLSQCDCYSGDIKYESEQRWNRTTDGCSQCRCIFGKAECSEPRCKKLYCGAEEKEEKLLGDCCPRCVRIPATTTTAKAPATTTTSTEVPTTTARTACQPLCDCMYGCDRDDSECQMLPNECPYTCICQQNRTKMNRRCAYIVPASQCLPGDTSPSPWTSPTIRPGNETTTAATSPPVTSSLPTCPSKCDCHLDCNNFGNCTEIIDCLVTECVCADPNADRRNGRCGHYPPEEECNLNITTGSPESTTAATATAASTTTEGVPITTTAPVCPYSEIVSRCPCRKTCEEMADPNFQCPEDTGDCQLGCDCPDGMLDYKGKCINNTSCPCYRDGNYYKELEEIPNAHPCMKMYCGMDGVEEERECDFKVAECDGEVDFSVPCCSCKPTTTHLPTLNTTSIVLSTASQSTTGVHTTSESIKGTATTVTKQTTTKITPSTPLITTPAITCAAPLVATTCGCNKTCGDHNATCSADECQTGCFCPSGHVMDGHKCVLEKDCPCIYNGIKYPSGGIWSEDICYSCKCENGKRSCEKTCLKEKCAETEELVRNVAADQCCYCRSLPVPTTTGTTEKMTTEAETTTATCNGCEKDGKCYTPGEENVSNCERCFCSSNNSWHCTEEPHCGIPTCEAGYHLVKNPGECCFSCNHTCPGQFLCPNGECIPMKWVCDRREDCKESGADEENCPPATTPVPTTSSVTGTPSPGTTTTVKTPVVTTTVQSTLTTEVRKTYPTSATAMTKITNMTTTGPATTTGYECKPPYVAIDCRCSLTCENIANGVPCPVDCEVGCGCPNNEIEHEGRCIRKEECPCYDLRTGKVFTLHEVTSVSTCETCVCAESEILCRKDCNLECEDYQELVNSTGGCCYCQDKTCSHDGIDYKYGEIWDYDDCMRCKCDESTGKPSCGETCKVQCPEGYDLVNHDPFDHVCCQCRPAEYCVDLDETKIYKEVGEKWSKGLCMNCECQHHNNTVCTAMICPSCTNGYVEEKSDTECCGTCVVLPPTTTAVPPETVTACPFRCDDGTCIANYQICDLYPDCHGGEDEIANCTTLRPPPPPPVTTGATTTASTTTVCNGFECDSNTRCLPSSLRCDNEIQCTDKTDEIGCQTTTTAATTVTTVVVTTPKPECSRSCICDADCDGSTARCTALPGCTRECKCPDGIHKRDKWRCIRNTPSALCLPVDTTTSPVTTLPIIPCIDSCTMSINCEQVKKNSPYAVEIPLDLDPFMCIYCQCGPGLSRILSIHPDICFKVPNTCEGCNFNGTDHAVGEIISVGNCRECECTQNETTGKYEMECRSGCQLTNEDCIEQGMVLVSDTDTCCECKPPTTTAAPSTTTAAPSTTTTVTTVTIPTTTPYVLCTDTCVVSLTCQQSRGAKKRSDPPFEVAVNCDECLCPRFTSRDTDEMWGTVMCLDMPEECKEECSVGNKTYQVNETFQEGDCKVCNCLYKDGLYRHECTPFCQLTDKKCAVQGKKLVTPDNACCECVEYPTVKPPSTTQITTAAVTATGPVTTPPTLTCPQDCYCKISCDDNQDHCVTKPGCSENECTCANGTGDTVNGRCILEPEPGECVSFSTTSAATTSPETTTSTTSATKTTTSQICNDGDAYTDKGTCQNCTCERGQYNCSSYCTKTCNENETIEQADHACCYCLPKSTTTAPTTTTPKVTTFPMSTTSSMSTMTTGPRVGGCAPTSINITVTSVDYPGCVSKEKVPLMTCVGTCPSRYSLHLESPYYKDECTCCKPAAVKLQEISLVCGDGTVKTTHWPQAESCSCEKCAFHPLR